MIVLSLFDGMSCGQIALDRLGLKVDKYYAAEIDTYAMKVTQANYPNTIQLGDVRNVYFGSGIDLMLGGSPCQGFSYAGKGLDFDDPRSKLFFEFVRIFRECKPKYFLFENVVMKQEHINVITSYLDVKPIMIDSSLVSAQSRKRLYWTNIPNVAQPMDKEIYLNQILEHTGLSNGCSVVGRRVNCETGKREDSNKLIKTRQYLEVNKDPRKSRCLTTVGKDTLLTDKTSGRHAHATYRRLTPIECERLQTVPDDYTAHVSDRQRYKMLGNGWTVDVARHIFKGLI